MSTKKKVKIRVNYFQKSSSIASAFDCAQSDNASAFDCAQSDNVNTDNANTDYVKT